MLDGVLAEGFMQKRPAREKYEICIAKPYKRVMASIIMECSLLTALRFAGQVNDGFGSTPVIENPEPNFRKGSIPTSEAIAGSAESAPSDF